MSQLSFDVIKRVWPKSGLTTFLKSTPVLLTWKFNIAAFELSVILLNTWYLDSVHTSGQERSPGVEGA